MATPSWIHLRHVSDVTAFVKILVVLTKTNHCKIEKHGLRNVISNSDDFIRFIQSASRNMYAVHQQITLTAGGQLSALFEIVKSVKHTIQISPVRVFFIQGYENITFKFICIRYYINHIFQYTLPADHFSLYV